MNTKNRLFPLTLSLIGLFLWTEIQAAPADSEMAKLSLAPIGDMSNPTSVKTSSYRMKSVDVRAFDTADLPKGVDAGILFRSEAEQGGSKGDCTVAKTLAPDFKMLGGWFYISPDSQIQRIGIQIQEQGGEYFLLTFPGDFTGWKWLEGKREDIVQMIPTEKSGFDGVFDQPASRVSIVWFAKDEKQNEVGVAGLTQGN